MNTQKTYDRQVAAFIAAVVQKIPDLSSGEMQYLIEHPAELTRRVSGIRSSLREFLRRDNESEFELIELHPQWDFLVLKSRKYPEMGIAVSDHSGSLGTGYTFIFPSKSGNEVYQAPCCCCNWYSQLGDGDPGKPYDGLKEACDLVYNLFDQGIVKNLLLCEWRQMMCTRPDSRYEKGFVGFWKEDLAKFDVERFKLAFGALGTPHRQVIKPIIELFR